MTTAPEPQSELRQFRDNADELGLRARETGQFVRFGHDEMPVRLRRGNRADPPAPSHRQAVTMLIAVGK
jgi:hypothetical protein